MDSLLKQHGALVGRVCLGLLFVFSGIGILMGGVGNTASYFSSLGLPMATILVWLVLILKLGAGGALIAGYKAEQAALALGIFTLLTIFIAHRDFMNDINFFKNLAIIGGLMYVYVYGPGDGWKLSPGKSEAKQTPVEENRPPSYPSAM